MTLGTTISQFSSGELAFAHLPEEVYTRSPCLTEVVRLAMVAVAVCDGGGGGGGAACVCVWWRARLRVDCGSTEGRVPGGDLDWLSDADPKSAGFPGHGKCH